MSTASGEIFNDYDKILITPILANLSCIHIPGEVFQSSEAYLEPSGTSTMQRFCKSKSAAILSKTLYPGCLTGF